MDKENKGTETTEETIPTPTEEKTEAELKIEALEAEKAQILEREANYKLAYLKEKDKNNKDFTREETEEEKIQRIVDERLSKARISEIDKEKETLLQKTLRENRELKLAQLGKTTTASTTTSTEVVTPVRDTQITPEQLSAFKSRGWTEKDIERYKKNLAKYGGR